MRHKVFDMFRILFPLPRIAKHHDFINEYQTVGILIHAQLIPIKRITAQERKVAIYPLIVNGTNVLQCNTPAGAKPTESRLLFCARSAHHARKVDLPAPVSPKTPEIIVKHPFTKCIKARKYQYPIAKTAHEKVHKYALLFCFKKL